MDDDGDVDNIMDPSLGSDGEIAAYDDDDGDDETARAWTPNGRLDPLMVASLSRGARTSRMRLEA